MKNLYIPKGKTLHYETLYCQNIVNDGTLIVDGTLHARSISGKGILKAGTVSVRHVAEMDIECATMNGETMAAERVCAAEISPVPAPQLCPAIWRRSMWRSPAEPWQSTTSVPSRR